MDEVTWIVDGKTIGKKEAFLKLIRRWSAKNDLVIQILVPLKWEPPFPVDQGDTMPTLWAVADDEKIRKYNIGWIPVDPPKPEK